MRTGLIAMSGIRACDGELMRLGLTLPGFVERSQAIASLPSLGLLTLAGMAPRRHEVEYLEVPELRAMEELPDRFDLVAISSYSAQIGEAYDLGRRCRERGVPVVLGGPHVSCLPREAIESCPPGRSRHRTGSAIGRPWSTALRYRAAGTSSPDPAPVAGSSLVVRPIHMAWKRSSVRTPDRPSRCAPRPCRRG